MPNEKPNIVLPSSRSSTTFAVEETQGIAEKLFAKAGFPPPGQESKVDTGLEGNPRNRSEAKWAIENATESAITYYSSPGNLQSLADDLRYLLPKYGVEFGDEDGPLDAKTKEAMDNKYKETLKDPAARAVYTSLLVKIYDGSVDRLNKVAAKTGDRSILQMGDLVVGEDGKALPQEVTKIGAVPKLQEAYRDAVKRDHDYMYELVTGEDGKTKVVKKKAPGLSDWGKDTSGGMMAAGSTDEALGYFMGSSARALFRLLPGFVGAGFRREVGKSSDIRVETAKVLEQIGELTKKKVEFPHSQAQAEGVGAGNENKAREQHSQDSKKREGNRWGSEGDVIDGDFELLEDKPRGGEGNENSPNQPNQPNRPSAPKTLPRGREATFLIEGPAGRDRD